MNPLGLFSQLRSYVGSYAGILGARFLTLIWVGAVCALVWFYGPKVPWGDARPLEPVRIRLIIIGVIITLWLVWTIISAIRNRRRDKAMIDDVAESPEARAERESSEEVAELRSRLKEAMKLLRKTVKRRFGFAYEFPWYILIGAPGAGKTTLLLNSGLKFPLGDAMGVEPLKGVGGTRNCNWWFTDQAIMIDTAGRYTTQESYQERDKAGWLGFLKLLKQHRPSQPINGVLITFSLTDLITQSPEDRLRETRAIRQRLSELEEGLKARIPVYLVLT
ncbi:MAG: type VI secretion protein IcmF/TssM N-terminal domain-containing protein, partial [Pseudomonadota bacterium]